MKKLTPKQKAQKLYPDLHCYKEPSSGLYFLWDDDSNPINKKGLKTYSQAWNWAYNWIREFKREQEDKRNNIVP